MRRFALRVLLLALACFVVLTICRADETATVTGLVTDPHGNAMPGAKVVVTNIGTNVETATTTNDAGVYYVPALRPGIYKINLWKDGFKSIAKTGIELHVQDVASFNFELQIGSVTETVIVEAAGLVINTTDASVSTVIDRQFVENIPLNGRSLQSLITLTPGVLAVRSTLGANSVGSSGEFSVNGQRAEANYFTLDGVSVNTGSNPFSTVATGMAGTVAGETALGTTQSIISLDALQEFRATTSTYSAEYGRTPGGQFSFVSRSGTNNWHGSVFNYFRNEALDANNWFSDAKGIGKTPERQNDFGGTLGGPLRIPGLYNGKDRTFFFFSYEGLRLQLPAGAITDPYPDVNLRNNAPSVLQPFLKAFPIPNVPNSEVLDSNNQPTGLALFTTGYSNPSSLDATSIRIDHNFNQSMKIFGRYNTSPSSAAVRQAGRDLANSFVHLVDVKSATLGVTNIFSPRLSNDFRFNYTHNNGNFAETLNPIGGAQPFDVRQVPGYEAAKFYDFSVFLNFNGRDRVIVGNQQDAQQQWNITDAFIVNHDSHSLRFGIDYRRLSTLLQNRVISEAAGFSSANGVLQNSPTFSANHADALVPPEPLYTNFSAYAMDDWKVTSRLSLSLGLRWELVPPPGNGNGPRPFTLNQITDLSTAHLAPQGTPLWQTDYRAFAPRLGAAYQLRQSANTATVVRGGFGVFYDMGTTLSSKGFFNIGFVSGFLFYPGGPFPLPPNLLTLPPPSVAAPYNTEVDAVDPHLRLPYTLQWNIAVEQALGRNQALTLTYVGSAGRRLIYSTTLTPKAPTNFTGGLSLIQGIATSDYDALQVQFQRRLSSGLQALLAYTWSHSIDDGTTNFYVARLSRRDSDFDIRHNFQMALTYDIPGNYSSRILSAILKHWGLDTRLSAQSALPVDLVGSFGHLPDGTFVPLRPDLVPNTSSYLYGSQYPGGRILNFNAFQPSAPNTQGNVPRNFVRSFAAVQADLAIRREFPIYERLRLQFRAEAFNIFNHPNFSSIDNSLVDGPYNPSALRGFGVAQSTPNNSLGGLNALYQVGGPRSLQLSLKLQF